MVKLEIDPLTDEQVEVIQSTLDILSVAENRRKILEEILAEIPEIAPAFSMVIGVDRQSAFLMNMMKRGFNYVCYQSFETIFDIFVRHPKYGIKLHHFSVGHKYVIQCIEEKASGDTEKTVETWKKVCDILEYIADQAYNRPDEKKLNKMKKRVMRSMTQEDIECVQQTWKTVTTNEVTVADIFATFLKKETKIIKKFHEHNIDVFKQCVIILRMITAVLKQLSDIEMLIPYLRKLGVKHVEMNVGPRLLASMRPIILNTLEKALGFAFTEEIKTSWNKVLAFIIGIMVESSRNYNVEQTTERTNDADASVDIDDIDLTDEIVQITQKTWVQCSTVIDAAVSSFYKDLLTSKPKIRNLFSKSNMQQQAGKLVRAIGSTIALLDNLETLVPILEELGRRHVYYNVRPKYFKHLKKAWFNMLRGALALQFTAEVEDAWNTSWKFITTVMITSLEDAYLLYIPPQPEKVRFKVLINHIDRVQVQNLSFYGDIWYAAYTGDNPSQSQAFQIATDNEQLKQEINSFYDSNNKPKELAPFGGVRILNTMDTKEMYRHKKERYLRKYSQAGSDDDTWYMRGNVRGTFAQQFDLRRFPFDQHNLTLTFALDVDDGVAILDEESLFVRLMPFKMESMAGADWDVYQPEIYFKQQSAMAGGSSSGKRYTHCEVSLPISRKFHHHIYETILPLLLIELVAYGVYFSKAFPMVERLTVVVTLLLTLFAFKWTVSKSMPPTPYLTLMDYFFNSAYFMLFLHIIGLSSLSFFEHKDADLIQFLNWTVCVANFAIWMVLHSYLFYKSRYYYSLYPNKEVDNTLGAVARAALNSPTKKKQSKKSTASKYQVQPASHEA